MTAIEEVRARGKPLKSARHNPKRGKAKQGKPLAFTVFAA